MKRELKQLLGFLAVRYGCRMFRFLNSRKLLILYYHRVVQPAEFRKANYRHMCIDTHMFEEQMRFLCKFYDPIGENEIIANIEGTGQMPAHPIWVTFDDGYKDNFENAYPILKKYNIPATFFVTTGFINKRIIPPEAYVIDGATENFFMDWDEVRQLSRNGFSIGAHTVTHRLLSHLTKDEIRHEISQSKYEIEKTLGVKVNSFAYPKGKTLDYDAAICVPLLKEAGFKLGVTTSGGYNRLAPELDNLNLRRMGLSDDDTFDFFKFKVNTGCFWQK